MDLLLARLPNDLVLIVYRLVFDHGYRQVMNEYNRCMVVYSDGSMLYRQCLVNYRQLPHHIYSEVHTMFRDGLWVMSGIGLPKRYSYSNGTIR